MRWLKPVLAVITVLLTTGILRGGQSTSTPCNKLLIHGHANPYYPGLSMFGEYVLYSANYDGKSAYLGPMNTFLYIYYGVAWVAERGGNMVYGRLAGAEDHCYQNPTGEVWEWFDGSGVDYDFEVECYDTPLGEYVMRLGDCPHDYDMANLVDPTLDITHADCRVLCDSDPTCASYAYSNRGCFPATQSCLVTQPYDELGFHFTRGLYTGDAVGRTAFQSSTDSQWNAGPERAVDGIVNGNFFVTESCSHTDESTHPWWMVDLAGSVMVWGIVFNGRSDCCHDRIRNVDIRVGYSTDLSTTQNNYNTGTFDGALCGNIAGPLGSGERPIMYCAPEPILGNFVAVVMMDATPSTLAICELEVSAKPAGQYQTYNAKLSKADANAFCISKFGGQGLVSIADDHEMEMLKAHLDGSGNAEDQMWIGNDPGSTYTVTNWDGATRPIWNIVSPSFRQSDTESDYCTSSSSLDSYTTCSAASDGTATGPGGWFTAGQGVGAWIKFTFRWEYKVHRVRLMQSWDAAQQFQDVTLTFSDSSTQSFTLVQRLGTSETDSVGRVWDDLKLTPLISSNLKISADTVYTQANNGFKEVQVWAEDLKGFKAVDGDCNDGGANDLEYQSGDVVLCQLTCRKNAACLEFVYDHDSNLCITKSAVCAPANVDISVPGVFIFQLTDTDGMTMRHGLCPANDLSLDSGAQFTPEQAHTRCSASTGCHGFSFNWAADINDPEFGTSWFKNKACDTPVTMSERVIWDLVTNKLFTAHDTAYVQCAKVASSVTQMEAGDQQGVSTAQECLVACQTATSNYAGAQWNGGSMTCRCGEKFWLQKGYCDTYCQGDTTGATGLCGGSSGMAIYYTGTPGTQPMCLYLTRQNRYQGSWEALDYPDYHMVEQECGNMKLFICERPFDDCHSNPCMNGATCTDQENYFLCTCAVGFTGVSCETDIDDCVTAPCINGGTCVDGVNTYTCNCDVGYTGATCETDVNECGSSPCENFGSCDDLTPGLYTCSCVVGYTGVNCEVDVYECYSTPCQHGGVCVDGVNMYTCNCPNGYEGIHCQTETNECASNPCAHGGTCTDGVGWFDCACGPGFSGDTCEIELQECASVPCQNLGTCVEGAGFYTCSCIPGFTGTNCEENFDECSLDECVRGQTVRCEDMINDYNCVCVAGFAGHRCENYLGNPGVWSTWGNWTECSSTCGDGVRSRQRECVPSFPELGTGNCPGGDTMSGTCVEATCPPVDGAWGAWSPSTACSRTCGPGVQQAIRRCDEPSPTGGGAACRGEDQRWQACKDIKCPRWPYCAGWTDFANCTGTCGVGTKTRQRWCYETQEESDAPIPPPDAQRRIESHSRACRLDACPDTPTAFSCAVCETTVNPLAASSLDCGGTPTECPGDTMCVSSYAAKSQSELSINKGCASTADCDAALTSMQTDMCQRLVAMGDASSYDLSSQLSPNSTGVVQPSLASSLQGEMVMLWRRVDNFTCSVCCTDSMCNAGLFPEWDSIDRPTIDAGASSIWRTSAVIAAILFGLLLSSGV